MNFQAYLENTYRIIKEEPLILILGGLIVQLLTLVTLGFLAGPFLGGYTLLVILYLRENKKPVFNDIFSGLQQFTHLFPYFLVLLFIFLGLTMLVIPGLVLFTWWLYVLPLMVDRRMSLMEAMRLSMSTVNEKGFFMHFVFVLLIYVIPLIIIEFLTAMLPFSQLLKIFLPPLQVGCLSGLYIDQFEKFTESDDKLNETYEGSIPVTGQQPEETGVQVKEESKQSEQPVSGHAENSDQAAPESFPEENVQDEKPKEADAPHNQTKKIGNILKMNPGMLNNLSQKKQLLLIRLKRQNIKSLTQIKSNPFFGLLPCAFYLYPLFYATNPQQAVLQNHLPAHPRYWRNAQV